MPNTRCWPDGSLHWIGASGKPEYNRDGKAVSMIGVTYDITDRLTNTRELERAFEQARLSKEAAQLGTFDMDLVKGTLEWDERCRLLFGINHQDTVTYEDDFLPGLHPDDRDRIGKLIENLFIKEISNGDYDVEYRTVGVADGKIRWVRAKGKVFFNEKDEPQRFIGSVLEITEQKENELRKNDFIGMVSHELKTPLTSLTAIVQVTNSKLKRSDDIFLAGAMDKANVQVKKMGTMINSFLNVARLESGQLEINPVHFVMQDLISELIAETSLIQPSHKIELQQCERISIYADKDKIGQVINNLISNAIKYSPKGTGIYLACKAIGDSIQFSIRDEGSGISKDDSTKLFNRFYRVDDPQKKHISGFGIGLYLSAEIVKQHNGKIWVESELGAGSTFFFSLPMVKIDGVSIPGINYPPMVLV